MSPVFSPPTVNELHDFDGSLRRQRYIHAIDRSIRTVPRGRTVYRKDNTWQTVDEPYWSDIKDADLVAVADRPGGERTDGTDRDRLLFLGGRTYTVSQAVADLLTTAGYSVS